MAVDRTEHSFPVVGWDHAGVQVAQSNCPQSVHLEMKPLPYSEQLSHRGQPGGGQPAFIIIGTCAALVKTA